MPLLRIKFTFQKCCIAAPKLIINLSSVPSADTFLTLILLPIGGRAGRAAPLILSPICGALCSCCCCRPPASPKCSAVVAEPLCSFRREVFWEQGLFMPQDAAAENGISPGLTRRLVSLQRICAGTQSSGLQVGYMPVRRRKTWMGFTWSDQSAVWAYSSISWSQRYIENGSNISHLL